MSFLPMSRDEMKARGWDEADIIFVSGDAYVDHPAWAAAILGKFLEAHGFRVGVIAQPDWRRKDDFMQLGQPRLFFAVSAGSMDSMVNHYNSERRPRREDLFSPGGQTGLRPDRATIVYCNRLREAFPGVPLVIGGVEASLRRLAHYDYWDDKLRRSILPDSRADLLSYGMGEYSLLEIARRLKAGKEMRQLTNIPGTVRTSAVKPAEAVELPSFEELSADREALAAATKTVYEHNNPYRARPLAQRHGERWVVQNPPPLPLTTEQMDFIYALPFERKAHPRYDAAGGIPALRPVQFSILTHRGCFGGCAFCSIGLHQGRFIQSRSVQSIIAEAQGFTQHEDFRGSIPDLGAASANMYGMQGRQPERCAECTRVSCLYPRLCTNMDPDPSPSLRLWRAMRGIKGINHIRVASGVRYDLILADPTGQYLYELCKYHVGGQLKVAPEHVAANVTRAMGKPGVKEYEKFVGKFAAVSRRVGKEQYLIPYFIAAHPGCGLEESLELAEFVRDHLHFQPEQVQNFTPTPMSIATAMYYSGLSPHNGQPVYVPRGAEERKQQRALLQTRAAGNEQAVKDGLKALGREELARGSRQALLPRAGKPTRRSRKK
ncbi:MAG: YgiQ family radical SAM protein [Syntrophomonadaceae bacterium]|nr:YgiQ family radical SAM protein [Syntrophomonadaceae bacterium]